jgi:hypothetical protein
MGSKGAERLRRKQARIIGRRPLLTPCVDW